jgi:4'-phosphopantetheinyl transferase
MAHLELGDGVWASLATPSAMAGELGRAKALLAPAERDRLDVIPSPHARERMIWGRYLLRRLVGELGRADPAGVHITARCVDCGGAHGRPVLAGDNPDALNLSVSACAGMVVVAVAAGRSVGIDIEPRAAGAAALQAVERLTGHTGDPLRHWTRVEAVLKADGRGLRVDPSRVTISGNRAELDGTSYRLLDVPVDPDFVVSVALGPGTPPGTREVMP